LNSDQKTAVARYDEVLQTLDITRDLYKQIVNIGNDAVKQQKKLARKEVVERMQQDIAKVYIDIYIYIHIYIYMYEYISIFFTCTNKKYKFNEYDI